LLFRRQEKIKAWGRHEDTVNEKGTVQGLKTGGIHNPPKISK